MKHTDDGMRAWQGVTSTGVVKGALALTLAASIAATPAVAFAAPASSTAQTETAAATAADQDAQYGATVTLANGETENFDWIVHAVEAINADTSGKYDDATLTFNKSVPSHPTYTLNKRVTVTAASKNYVFGGTLVLTVDGSAVKGMHFALNGTKDYDNLSSTRSIQVKGASNVTIEDNIFDITDQANAAANTQFNSIWVEGDSDDLTVTGNEFNIAAHDNGRDWQAINLIGNSKVIEGAEITGNTLNAVKGTDAANGAVMFMVANGNVEGSYGVKDIAFTGNKVYNQSGISRLDSKIYGLAVRSVSGVTFTGNLFDQIFMPLSYSAWNGSDEEPLSTGIVTSGNDMGTSSYSYLFKQGSIAEGGITLGTEKSQGLNGSAKSFPAGIATADGVKGYTSVQAAINGAKDGGTVQLLDIKTSIDESVTVPRGKQLTLDLAGRTLWNTEGKHTIINKGELVITDSSARGRGTVNNISNGRAAIVNYAGATVTLKGGTYTRSEEKSSLNGDGTTSNGGNSYYVLKNFGTMNIEDGATVKFSDSNAGYESSLVSNGWYSSSDTDGDDVNAYGTGTATLNIKGGALTGGKIVVKNDDYGVLNMTGGTLTQPTGSFFGLYTVNDATITGGSITAPKTAVGIGGNGQAASGLASKLVLGGTVKVESSNGPVVALRHDNATVRITGGTYIAGADSAVTDGKGSTAISGGSFNVEPAAGELAPGFSATKADDGSFTVQTAESTVATVALPDGTVTGYERLTDAVAAANKVDGATVTLLKDVTDHASIVFDKKVTFQAPAGSGVTFNGTVRLKGSESKVTGIHFVYDVESTYTANLIVSTNTTGVEISGNTFEVTGAPEGKQPNSVWLEGSASNVSIDGNTFKLADAPVSVVGVALTGWASGGSIDSVKITNNTVTMLGEDASGFNMFIKAYGARNTTKHEFGITNLTVSGNTFDSEQPAGVGNFLGLSNVNGLTYTGNTVKNTTYGVFSVTYKDISDSNTGIVASGNTNVNVTYPLNMQNVNLKNEDGSITPGLTIKDSVSKTEFTDVSQFRSETEKKTPTGPTTMAFVGWYKDADLTEALGEGNVTGAAYAKFVPISSIITYKGGSLRMDYADGEYSKTSLRFGYDVRMADGCTQVLNESGWSWDIDISDGTLDRKTLVVNSADNGDGSIMTNLVFTGIEAKNYSRPIYTKAFVVYTTADGTKVTVSDTSTRTHSVETVAQAIQASDSATEAERAYAAGILAAIDKQ